MNNTATINEHATEVINDLVKINNDRIEGYETAIKETKDGDSDLRSLFQSMKQDSMQLKQELANVLARYGEDPTKGTRADGKIYRAWMDVKATFSGNSRKAVLENCEYGEDAAQKAYKNAISDNDLPSEVRTIIVSQQSILKADHDKIRQLRDAE
ncbi:MAG: aldehyde dehydrogenase [Flavipsychrobacter sp.]|jgi:uncharacterized protein (TIGR02284 family)|nr:aldehyde dehydrogenase [Flavipsychrobacter sp.]